MLATFFDLPLMFVYVDVAVAIAVAVAVAVAVFVMLFALMFHLPHNLNIANIQTSLLLK